ncbi:HD domain-containing protein (plasmid) [Deinococcus radiomollis]|uniref:HD domain-containing phosphohydrolase n=1 Tax=Deinococcus radiomollis TaxID=468916 RepID=UPI003891C927
MASVTAGQPTPSRLRQHNPSGHGAGDTYIRGVAQALQTALFAIGTVGRWGGDEFAAIIPDLPEKQVVKAVDALLSTTPLTTGGLPVFAYGTATLTTGETLERAFALADQRMYERKELQRTTRTQHSREINAVEEVSRELELLRTSEALLTSGLPLVASLLRFDVTFYVQRQPATGTWVITKLHAQTGTELPPPLAEGITNSLSGVLGRALREKRIVWSTDYPTDPEASPIWVEAGLKTIFVAPVRCLGEIVGRCCLANFGTWRSVTPQVRRIAETTALRLGHVLDLEQVERNVRRAEQDVRATLEGGLLGLGAALEARDLETGGHTRRVVEHSARLGKALGLPPDQLLALRQGAYLHDIGKLVIPDAILLKPGKLYAEEWDIMKTHSSEGRAIATSIPTLTSGAVDVIHHHHERWDGSGYPDGLRGEAIPLVARIFSVCDVYDALISDRPYKVAWGHEEAVLEIERQAGRHFDPEVVRAFLSLMVSGTRADTAGELTTRV